MCCWSVVKVKLLFPFAPSQCCIFSVVKLCSREAATMWISESNLFKMCSSTQLLYSVEGLSVFPGVIKDPAIFLKSCSASQRLTWRLLFICPPLRSLNWLHCQQAVLDQLGQRHYQQVQSGRQRDGSAGDSKEGVSQRHSSGRDGWVELVTSASDCHWGLVRECGGITSLTS